MHVSELVELAAIVSARGPGLIHSGQSIPTPSVEQYWTTSKVRLDRWAWRLKRFVEESQAGKRRPRDPWPEVRGVLEEILAGEVLTRVWTALLCAYDRHRGGDEVEPAARSVLIGHMEARHRALTLLVRGPGVDAESAVKLNRLRRRAERWTDLLLGHLVRLHEVSEFAFDPRRAGQFADDFRQRGLLQQDRQVWPLTLAALRAAFRQGLSPRSPSADLNARIAGSILSCFASESFDSTGLLRSLWLMRLSNVADDTQGMIEDLLTSEHAAGTGSQPAPSAGVPGDRRRRFGG
jgi:hypothetical protein